MIRVLIADDSITVRKTIADHLDTAGFEVVGEAADGREVVTLTRQLRPDVVLMDIVMPGVDGLAATRHIMEEIPTPTVILSGYASEQEVFTTYDALAAGALEVCAKPTTDRSQCKEQWDAIVLTICAAAQVPVMKLKWSASSPHTTPRVSPEWSTEETPSSRHKLVVIGASTGGPAAVKRLLQGLPSTFPLPLLITIHCSSHLPASFADWFDGHCTLRVRDARHGEPVPVSAGVVLVAPPGRNLKIRGGRTVLTDATGNPACTPSVDELFTSAADQYGNGTVGVLLTGMGADGALGLKHIHDLGGYTIAQDETTSVVYGMPCEARKIGAVAHGTPLEQIPIVLARLLRSPCGISRPPSRDPAERALPRSPP